MFSGRKLTLLLIPEAGERTYEFKVSYILVWFWLLLVAIGVVLLAIGGRSFFDARSLASQVDRLQREKQHLTEAISQINELEVTLSELKNQSDQLKSILGSSMDRESRDERVAVDHHPDRYISSTFRLQSGQIRTVPILWPTRGTVLRPFDEKLGGILLAIQPGSLVRATAAGRIVESSYEEGSGRLLKISHSNGLLTIYGQNRNVLAEVGEYVYRGQPIALSGSTMIYYAVYENGQPRNPNHFRLWL